jgi:hypothetical protein
MLNKPPPTATIGERMFFNRVERIFPSNNNTIGYFEPEIGGLRPDFLILSPHFGVIVIEVKDYSPTKLLEIAKSGDWQMRKGNGRAFIVNPFDQIYQYWRAIKDRINSSQFPEEVQIPITKLVVFSQISQDKIIAQEIRKIAPSKIHICFKETLGRNAAFEQFLCKILPEDIHLKKKHFQTLRANLIPTCRLPMVNQVPLNEYFTAEDKIALLDREQEVLARKLGEGHRLLFGVAGSGKTILLIARARYLAIKHPDWKILVLCYNKLLKDLIFHLLNPLDYNTDITISTFHAWVRHYILMTSNGYAQIYQEAEQKAQKEGKLDEFFHEFVPKIFLQILKNSGEKKVLYDAILIDEAQDFEEDWFRGVIEILNPDSNSLLITCDGLQGIYARKRFYWSDVGIQARGRVKKFDKSYRTPIEIGILAQKSLPDTLRALMDKYDEFISTKEYIGNHGIIEILVSDSREEEYNKLVNKIREILRQQQPQEVLVLFKRNMEKINFQHPFFELLKQSRIAWKTLQDHNFESPGLLIGTIHGSKGLESDTIIIPEVNTYSSDKERQLLYVGITRSRKKLILSAHKSTKLIQSFETN